MDGISIDDNIAVIYHINILLHKDGSALSFSKDVEISSGTKFVESLLMNIFSCTFETSTFGERQRTNVEV